MVKELLPSEPLSKSIMSDLISNKLRLTLGSESRSNKVKIDIKRV